MKKATIHFLGMRWGSFHMLAEMPASSKALDHTLDSFYRFNHPNHMVRLLKKSTCRSYRKSGSPGFMAFLSNSRSICFLNCAISSFDACAKSMGGAAWMIFRTGSHRAPASEKGPKAMGNFLSCFSVLPLTYSIHIQRVLKSQPRHGI
jgi:hypothetical protein